MQKNNIIAVTAILLVILVTTISICLISYQEHTSEDEEELIPITTTSTASPPITPVPEDYSRVNEVMFQRRGAPLKEGQPREGFYYRTWTEYENGFGDQDADFWLGLKRIHALTKQGFTRLSVNLEDWEGNQATANYSVFKVAGPATNYKLYQLGSYSGTAGPVDSMARSRRSPFTTFDRDTVRDRGCSWHTAGPGWHDGCPHVRTYLFAWWLKRDATRETCIMPPQTASTRTAARSIRMGED
ncbi:ficolin-3 isoform X2 [Folsomia candida]|uniref:ficolin-3 isoform X2 n=1 Tax=Folsomia candida TaxID=158441 RepID=UPI000B8FA3BC|nr:ficolin-3 isoform X2 [Folsomia candida]